MPVPRKTLVPWLFLTPVLLFSAVFTLYPFFYSIVLSFHQSAGPAVRVFVGVDNFSFIVRDPDFHIALRNTLAYTFFSLCLQLPLSLGLALLLNQNRGRLKGLFRLLIFSPHLVGPIFVGILFSVLFTPRYGLFNRSLQWIFGWGLEQRWLGDPALVMPALIITALWMYTGFNMIYFLAALQNVDQGLVEAAHIDGASPSRVFFHVTLPAIRPVVLFVVVMSTIGSFQLFELPFALLQGYGPSLSGLTIVGYLYRTSFEAGDLGTGAAVGWLLALMIMTVSLAQIRVSRTVTGEAA